LKAVVGRKAGHAGTLDKFASGLLIAFSGRCTRLNELFMGLPKRYKAAIRFGEETDTLDPEGTVVRRADIPAFDLIQSAVESFRGLTMQSPPTYSAVHLNGRRAYRMARSGERPEIPLREVRLHDYEVLGWNGSELEISLLVSKGFYVRSFARDLAVKLGSAAYVRGLRRTAIGPYSVDEASDCDDEPQIRRQADGFDPVAFLSRLDFIARIPVSESEARFLDDGVIPKGRLVGNQLCMFTCGSELVSVISGEGRFIYQRGKADRYA
ncbi:MAG: tRNA pseudouridine(55) synthase TruB, partial [Sphaerochaetaceae bacterium]